MIENAKDDSKSHVDYSYDHRHLHLIGVQEGEAVECQVPDLQSANKILLNFNLKIIL